MLSGCALSLSINHSTFVCTRYNDPLTTSVAGNLKNIVMTGVGVYAFGDFFYHKFNALGIAISMIGAIWYATWSAMRVSLSSLPSCPVSTVSTDLKVVRTSVRKQESYLRDGFVLGAGCISIL